MARSAKTRQFFGDRIYDFALKIERLVELQELCDAGPEEIWDRIGKGTWRVADIQETIRLGLIGGEMQPTRAAILVERYAGAGNLVPWKPLAQAIIGAALIGAPEEDQPSGEPKGETPTASPDAKSASASSTKSAGRSGSRRRKSAEAPSGS